MQVGDINVKYHNYTNAKTKEKHTETEEIKITQKMINDEILRLLNDNKSIEEIEILFDRQLTLEELDIYNAPLEEERIKAIYTELDALDKVVSRDREEFENTVEAIKAELIAEVKAKLEIDIVLETKVFTNDKMEQAKAKKKELRKQL